MTGAAGYDLYLQDTTSGNQIFNALPIITTSYAVSAPLTNGDTYQWYVQAYDNYGDIGLPPAPLTFSISLPPATAAIPEPTGPIGKTKGATPTLQWSPVPNAVGYDLYVTDTTTGQPIPGSPFSVPAGTGTGDLSYPLSTSLPGTDSYSFYVRAVFADGTVGPPGQSSPPIQLNAPSDLAGPPTPATPVGPTSSTQPTFLWSAVANATGYYIEIEDTTDNTISYVLSQAPVNGTSYSLSQALTPGHTYQWQVAAYDSAGQETAWSSPASFSITSAPLLYVEGIKPAYTKKGHKITAVTIVFDEALEAASAESTESYQVARQVAVKHKRPVYGAPIGITVVYHGGDDVTVMLDKPVKGPVRFIVTEDIMAADGTRLAQPYTTRIG